MLSGKLIPWCWALFFFFLTTGFVVGFFYAPVDRVQGEVYRIIFVHVPAAWVSMLIYLAMAFWAAMNLVMKTRLSAMMAQALAPTGAMMAFLSLWTGAVWGKSTWGAWWVWDARLTSQLILFFLFIGFISLRASIDSFEKADKVSSFLAVLGVINLPIIYFSVKWWKTLHQGASVSFSASPSMATVMLVGMLLMTVAFWSYAIAVALVRIRIIILERESHLTWIQELMTKGGRP